MKLYLKKLISLVVLGASFLMPSLTHGQTFGDIFSLVSTPGFDRNDAIDLIVDVIQAEDGISITTSQADQLLSLAEDYVASEITFDEYVAQVTALLNAGSSSGGVSVGESVLRASESVIRNQLFSPAKTKQEEEAEAAARSASNGISIGSDLYYSETELTSGTDIETFGANLSATFGDEYEFTVTLPISQTEVGAAEWTTYGLDFSMLVEINEIFKVGGHANYLESQGDVENSSFTVGPVGSARFDLSEDLILSLGALLDRVEFEGLDEEWVGAFGANLGYAVSDDFVVNPYVIYYKNFDAASGVDDDWYDLGLEGSVALGGSWTLTAGFKLTEDYDPVDDSWEIYFGSGFQF